MKPLIAVVLSILIIIGVVINWSKEESLESQNELPQPMAVAEEVSTPVEPVEVKADIELESDKQDVIKAEAKQPEVTESVEHIMKDAEENALAEAEKERIRLRNRERGLIEEHDFQKHEYFSYTIEQLESLSDYGDADAMLMLMFKSVTELNKSGRNFDSFTAEEKTRFSDMGWKAALHGKSIGLMFMAFSEMDDTNRHDEASFAHYFYAMSLDGIHIQGSSLENRFENPESAMVDDMRIQGEELYQRLLEERERLGIELERQY
ncbi:hypothetical protein [Pleionea sp. CnH1-48]|uniref:hypothetical protein n=1 Tax=Pleionea sp. CnH1-48 TaxID=2954494 RepID=UPI002098357A|nr:hypothetical protein [Pleionea sp. CnH1-48]MCO7223898.1 hypothetical protein [Pleionea sp. CnH1-48]